MSAVSLWSENHNATTQTKEFNRACEEYIGQLILQWEAHDKKCEKKAIKAINNEGSDTTS
jgi:hypothetical protein